ncbi:hypothetical protein H2200_011647 [Cladophialophora chaetospira]|uniref:Uncharacterized protein n=1 Tax=Cladophialophora chaetospira TaxID=386627 RepID=A0AA38WZQ5_9EURO|nr:hypothetical protein H2200_011647 [Cladophialophora chaetospira]
MANTSDNTRPELIHDDPDLIRALGLDWTPEQTQDYLSGIKVFKVKRLAEDQVKPTPGVFWAEDEKAKEDWSQNWDGIPLAEDRDKRKGKEGQKLSPEDVRKIEVVGRDVFPYILKRGDAALFYDEDSGDLVFARLPNTVKNKEILAAITDVCKKTARERRGNRRDDPGHMALGGITAGRQGAVTNTISRSHLRETRHTDIEKARIHFEESSMASIVWNIITRRMPPEVKQDFDDGMAEKNLRRMDGGVAGDEFPHTETGGNTYVCALTTISTADPATGGNFFNAQYGILSLAEEDTITVWRVGDNHGTSLYHLIPRQNTGVAFFISANLKEEKEHSEPKYTLGQILNTKRPDPPVFSARRKRIAEHVSAWYLYEEPVAKTDQDFADAADITKPAGGEELGPDGATFAENELLDTSGQALGELWENCKEVDSTGEDPVRGAAASGIKRWVEDFSSDREISEEDVKGVKRSRV